METTFAIGGDVLVRRLGFGAMRLCGPNILGWPEPREHALRMLRRAVELDVQLIDTALAYGAKSTSSRSRKRSTRTRLTT